MLLTERDSVMFLAQVRPCFERQDGQTLLTILGRNWPNPRLVSFLESSHTDATKAALMCLSLTGTMYESEPIVRKLAASDPMVAIFAEHAIWAIWFRAGDRTANHNLCDAVDQIMQDAYASAIRTLDAIVYSSPGFAEAYHQRAAARYLAGHVTHAMEDCGMTLKLNPHHFSAMTFYGHCNASRGRRGQAVAMYEEALRVHPRYEPAHRAIAYVRRSGDSASHLSRHVLHSGRNLS
jgi:tetratricopeptide (TPR) repeat protein